METSALMGVKHQRLAFEALRSRGDVQSAYPKLTGSALLRRNYTSGNSLSPPTTGMLPPTEIFAVFTG